MKPWDRWCPKVCIGVPSACIEGHNRLGSMRGTGRSDESEVTAKSGGKGACALSEKPFAVKRSDWWRWRKVGMRFTCGTGCWETSMPTNRGASLPLCEQVAKRLIESRRRQKGRMSLARLFVRAGASPLRVATD